MSEWKECTVGDVVSLVIDYRGKTPKKLGGDWSDSGYRALSAKNVKTGMIVQEDSIRYVDESLYKAWMKDEVERGDILITSEAPFGQIFYWDSDEKIVLSQRLFALRIKKEFCARYIYYYMTSFDFQKELDGRATGTTVVGLRQPELMKCKIAFPPLAEQQRIAGILSSLDDKIELNNKINDNLEKQAQALFKNWFIDYAPFGGVMPEDWIEGKLSDIADYEKDKINISALTESTYYSTENMLPGKAGVCDATNLPSIEQTSRCYPGETIVSNIRPYFKKIYYCSEEIAGCSTDVLCFKPIKPSYSVFNYCLLFSDTFFDYMMKGAKGTKMPRGDKSQIMNYEVPVPSETALHEFNAIASPMLQQIQANRNETQRLTTLRDSLLPKLMSGEITVENIQI